VHTTPWNLAEDLGALAAYCSSERYPETLGNVTPDDVYFARRETMLEARGKLKAETSARRNAVNLGKEAEYLHQFMHTAVPNLLKTYTWF